MNRSTANTPPKNSHETDRASEETGEELNETLQLQQLLTSLEEVGLGKDLHFPQPIPPEEEREQTSDIIEWNNE